MALTAYGNISSHFINSLKSLRWAAEANIKHEPSYRFTAVTRLTVMRKRCWLIQQNPKEVKKKHKHQKRETKGMVTCGRLVIFDHLVHCECPQKDARPSS